MREIALTQGKFALVDEDDFEWLNQWKWFCNMGYARRKAKTVNGGRQTIHMHREILRSPPKSSGDHINGNTLDNRKINLRESSVIENCRNRRLNKNNSSGFKGVYFDYESGKWKAQIGVFPKRINLGRYLSATDAAEVYDIAAFHLYGDFANYNFPNGENLCRSQKKN